MNKKLFLLLAFLSSSFVLLAQTASPCYPPEPICATCYEVKVINETDCDLSFCADYPQQGTCSGFWLGVLDVPAGQDRTLSKAPCMKKCDLPCQCPTTFKLTPPDGSLAIQWTPSIYTCCSVVTYASIFSCNGCEISLDVQIISGVPTFRYYKTDPNCL